MDAKRNNSRCGRRAVLRGMGAAGLGVWAAPLVLPAGVWAAGEAAPHNKLHIAAVGTVVHPPIKEAPARFPIFGLNQKSS